MWEKLRVRDRRIQQRDKLIYAPGIKDNVTYMSVLLKLYLEHWNVQEFVQQTALVYEKNVCYLHILYFFKVYDFIINYYPYIVIIILLILIVIFILIRFYKKSFKSKSVKNDKMNK
jgi:prepilin signal peptidase PulO-like enzyme (type II secretory pathway)